MCQVYPTGGEFITEAQLYISHPDVDQYSDTGFKHRWSDHKLNQHLAVFVKLGFNETSENMSLLTLALSDLLSTILTLWGTLCITPGFSDAELPFLPTK
ncbi:hypothetical protein RRG08_056053 [Elysia crispata]|uniref:Uncharacterized protein n=1 Tax=Elysia crispata TaxID=231223 RepID=A0AAE1EB72_9GAST|nr:hypothetical protein RRG08_056053 [Elysia crispata]